MGSRSGPCHLPKEVPPLQGDFTVRLVMRARLLCPCSQKYFGVMGMYLTAKTGVNAS